MADTSEQAPKRQKLSSTSELKLRNPPGAKCLRELIDATQKNVQSPREDTQSGREAAVGILNYANSTHQHAFSGILKKRYSDFIVNEIALDGTVYHLVEDRAVTGNVDFSRNPQSRELQKSPNLTLFSNPDDPQLINLKPPNNSITQDVPEDKILDAIPDSDNAKLNPTQSHAPKNGTIHSVTAEDENDLLTIFGEETKNYILRLYHKMLEKPTIKPKQLGPVLTPPVSDRQLRGQMHQTLRRIFQNRLESSFDEVSKGIRIFAVSMKSPQNSVRRANPCNDKHLKGKIGWNERGGEYLHMSLYKQDRDTMEVISYMARCLKVKPRAFSFAGTKDRRAVTTQRVSAYRLTAEMVAKINGQIHNAAVGDFRYEKYPLELGELKGNLFTVTLRECHFSGDDRVNKAQICEKAGEIIDLRCKSLALSGFINYYGLQRFGTFEIGTHIIGKLILQERYDQAVACILSSSSDAWYLATEGHDSSDFRKQIGKDELDRAKAIRGFSLGEIKLDEALAKLPRRFNAERNILQHLKSCKGNDYLGALLNVPRNLRLMYVHAYQSYVWNEIASERWARYGNKVVAGDLVLIDNKNNEVSDEALFDECGEIIVQPAAHDISIARDIMFERARALGPDEIAGGEFTLSDIVLPLPGFDVEYPTNDVGQFFKTFMGSEKGGGLDPTNMRRKQKDFSLSGSYRKLLATINNISSATKLYYDENEKLVETDMDRILQKRAKNSNNVVNTDISCAGNRTMSSARHSVNDHRKSSPQSSSPTSKTLIQQISDRSPNESITIFDENLDRNLGKIINEGKLGNSVHATSGTIHTRIPFPQESILHMPCGLSVSQKESQQTSQEIALNEEGIDLSMIHSDSKLTVTSESLDDSSLKTSASPLTVSSTTLENPILNKTNISSSPSKLNSNTSASFLFGEETPELIYNKMIIDQPKLTPDVLMLANPKSKNSRPLLRSHQESDMEVDHSYLNSMKELVSDASLGDAKLGVILKFKLSSSQYATMFLRELMGADNVRHYQPQFGVSK